MLELAGRVVVVKGTGGQSPTIARSTLERFNLEAAQHAEIRELWMSVPTDKGRQLLRLDLKTGDLSVADRSDAAALRVGDEGLEPPERVGADRHFGISSRRGLRARHRLGLDSSLLLDHR